MTALEPEITLTDSDTAQLIEVDPIDKLVGLVEQYVRPQDAFAIGKVIQNVVVDNDDDPLEISHVLHSSLTANAYFDGATQNELNYLKPPPMTRVEYEALPTIELPVPDDIDGELGDVLEDRRTDYNYSGESMTLAELSTMLHHAAGVKGSGIAYNVRDFPKRRFPSAGGLQPVDIMLAINDVEGVEKGMYYFDPVNHCLRRVDRGNLRGKILESTIFAEWMFYAPVVAFLTHDMARVRWKYGTRGYRFMHVDLGVMVQSLYLVGTALDFSTCAVAAFDDQAANKLLRLDGRERFVSLLFAFGPSPRS